MRKGDLSLGVIGLWHLGSVYSASLARLGFDVHGFDENKQIIDNLNKGMPSIEEPGLKETILAVLNNNLHFSNKSKEAISNKKYVFVTYDTPVDDKDEVDLSVIERTSKLLAENLSPNSTIVISSQLPVGYSRKIFNLLSKKVRGVNVIYFPENLRLGTAFDSFLKADRVVIGSNNPKILDEFEDDFSSLNCPFVKVSLESAEMVKHMLNSYLALMISFSSEISDLVELLGGNMQEIVNAVKTDRRVSQYAPLNPGLGFAGGTLGRDVQTLRKLAKKSSYKTLLLDSVYQVNRNRLPYLINKIKSELGDLRGKSIGILGLTYKPNTNTLRRSMGIEVSALLSQAGAKINAFDPTIKKQIPNLPLIEISDSLEKFFYELDAVVLMTDWPDFRNIDWKNYQNKVNNKLIVDTKNFLDSKEIEKSGFKYQGIGFSKYERN